MSSTTEEVADRSNSHFVRSSDSSSLSRTSSMRSSTGTLRNSLIRRGSLVLPPTQVINLIDFETFKLLDSMPRNPESDYLCVDLMDINHEESLIVFISHSWIRGSIHSEGYTGQAHPDNPAHDKFRLCVTGIQKIKDTMAPDMAHCYIWLDFGCLNQDATPAIAFHKLSEIIQFSDCLFTPVPSLRPPMSVQSNWYTDYKAPGWSEGNFAYIDRGWCRVEMFYAANLPVDNSTQKIDRFRLGLRHHCLNRIRPHFLYGTTEHTSNLFPIILPPLKNSYFEDLNPIKGKITQEGDRDKITALVDALKPLMKPSESYYNGPRNSDGKPHGQGEELAENGNFYQGDWVEGKKSGQGLLIYASGDRYQGSFEDDLPHGFGSLDWAVGASYVGDFDRGLKVGYGRLSMAVGHHYEGFFHDDHRHGFGKMVYNTGELYAGMWEDRLRHGCGRMEYLNGDVYEGEWRADERCGVGVLWRSDGTHTDGKWVRDQLIDEEVAS